MLVNMVLIRYYLLMDILITQQLLERLSGLIRSENRALLTEHGLQPIHFDALHYLSISNRYSDTPMAVTEFLGQTKGTISQSLKVLEKKGLLEKVADKKDKRVIHLKITPEGTELVKQLMPAALIQGANDKIGKKERLALNKSLENLLLTIQEANQYKSFGQCQGCKHNQTIAPGEYKCGLTQETLTEKDIKLICREHESV